MKYAFALVFISVLILVFMSGCTILEQFGTDVINVKEEATVEGSSDMIVITDVRIEEGSTILPEQDVTLGLTIENNDDEKIAENVIVDLFDPSMFVCLDENGEESDCVPDQCGKASPCSIPPGGLKRISFSLKAPTEERTGNLVVDITPTFQVKYDFENTLSYEIKVVNSTEITRLRRLGEIVSFNTAKSIGSGPVQLDAQLKSTAGFVLAGQPAAIIFTIKDIGTQGSLEDSKLGMNRVKITFRDMTADIHDSFIVCSDSQCNLKDITLYQGQSDPLIFTIPQSPAGVSTYKSFYILGEVSYTYDLRGSLKVTVAPWRS